MEFRILLKRLTPRLKNLSRRLLRIRSAQGHFDAEDIFQEMCVHLWQKFNNGAPPEFNDSYIIKGCEFHIRNYLRKETDKYKSKSLDEPINETGLSLKDILANTESVSNACFNKILIDEIKNKITNEKEQRIFNLLIEGHTVRCIGARLGISHVMVIKYKNKIINRCRNDEKNGYRKNKIFTSIN